MRTGSNFTTAFTFQVHNNSICIPLSPRLLQYDAPVRLTQGGVRQRECLETQLTFLPYLQACLFARVHYAKIYHYGNTAVCSVQHLHFKYHHKLSTSLQPTLSKIWDLLDIQLRSPDPCFDLLEQNSTISSYLRAICSQ